MPAAAVRRGWEGKGIRRLAPLPGYPQTTPPISGYDAWYDPSDLATVTSSAGRISAIADKGSGGNNLTANGNPGLGILPNFLGGQPGIYFSNTTAQQFSSNRTMSDITSSAFCVGILNAFAAARVFVAPNNDGGLEFSINNSGLVTLNKSDNALIAQMSTPAVSVGVPFVTGYACGTSDCTLYLNLSSETDSHAQTLTAARTLIVGRVPNNATTTGEFFGYMGEIVMYPTQLSSGDALAVIGYLMSKWGITA